MVGVALSFVKPLSHDPYTGLTEGGNPLGLS